MPWHKEYLKINIIQNLRRGFIEQEVGGDRLHIELEAEVPEKFRVGHHRERFTVVGDLAPMLALDAGGVEDVVHMPVREQQERDFVSLGREPLRRALRGIDEDTVLFKEEAICVKGAAGEGSDAHGRNVNDRISSRRGKSFSVPE